MVSAIEVTRFCISVRASPVAPVFWITISIAPSTSCHAATDPAPIATIGPVTNFVMPSPRLLILLPTSFTFSPTSFICCSPTDPKLLRASSAFLSSTSSSAICVCRSLAAFEFSSKPSEFLSCSRASFSACRRLFASSTESLRLSCFNLSSSTFPESNFRALFISRKLAWVSLTARSTSDRDFVKLVVSPPISIVIPLILPDAIQYYLTKICQNHPALQDPDTDNCRYLIP